MKFTSRFLGAFGRKVSAATGNVTSAISSGNGGVINHQTCFLLEQIAVGVVLSVFLGLIGRFLPFYVSVAVIAVGFGVAWQLGRDMRVGSATFLALSTFYFVLTQPTVVLILSGLVGLGAAAVVGWRSEGILRRTLLSLGALVAGFAVTVGLYWLMYTMILPAVHPLTIVVWNVSPVIAVAVVLLASAYCTYRQPVGEDNWYWAATPVLLALSLVVFWPSHSYIGMAVGGLTAAGLSVVSYLKRTSLDHDQRSHIGFAVTAAAGVIFVGVFWLSNSWTWLYNYQMANAISITRADKLPPTNNNRLVPYIAGRDYCAQRNFDSYTELGQPNPLIKRDDKGSSHFYWVCMRHPNDYRGHWIWWLTGGTDGALLADAGEVGREVTSVDVHFLFGENSPFTKGTFYARHPGAVAERGLMAFNTNGQPRLLIPYTSRVLQLGAMVPELSGVMAMTPAGLFEDYTPSQAAAAFPGVHFMPSDLARQYADLWAQQSSLYAQWMSGDVWKVSDFAAAGDNQYPFWQDFKSGGLKGVIPFEQSGSKEHSQNDLKGLRAVGLFDRAELSMTVIDVRTSGAVRPEVVSNVAISHPGLFNVRAAEAILVVTDAGRVYWLTALLQQGQTQYHGYSRNVLYDGTAQNYWDITASATLEQVLAQAEKAAEAAKLNPVMAPLATPTPDQGNPVQAPPASSPAKP